MKQFLLFAFVISSSLLTSATIRTVSNNPNTIAQFNDIASAVAAANAGDTIEIMGSPNSYAGFTLSKQLTFIGAGWSPDKNLPYTTNINTAITINNIAANGSEFHGIFFTSGIGFSFAAAFANLKFIRNHFGPSTSIAFGGASTYSGFVFESNWFDNSAVNGNTNTIQNFLFNNNIFFNNGAVSGNIQSFTNCVSVLFDHNLWYGPSSSSLSCFGGAVTAITLTNNIFVRRDASVGLNNSTFSNNITFNAGNNTPWTSVSNLDAGGNISNTNPQMTDQTSVNNGTDDPLLNFTLNVASPAHNTGGDGKDMGLLFDAVGSLNWTNARNSRLPRIFSMNIVSSTITAGNNLNVNVVGKVSN